MRLTVLAFALSSLAISCVPSNTHGDGTGGTPGTGGKIGTGGSKGKGGAKGTGGVKGTGGSTAATSLPPASVDCQDTSTDSLDVAEQYGGAFIHVSGSNKTYYMAANWWGKFSQQTENISGLGFTVNDPAGTASSSNLPIGFPTIFIGTYAGHATKESNLPKQVSDLTSVPTVLETNADQKGSSQYNATYDVWFTQGSSTLPPSQSDPGRGGAFLMVWLFKPSDRQPRGTIVETSHVVSGMPGEWTIWYDNSNPSCVSYVSETKLSSLSFDLNNFIKDAVTNDYGVKNSQYLSLVFGGFEVWAKGDGLKLKRFCANVK